MDDNEDDEDNTTISEDDEYDGFAFLQKDIVCSNHDKVAITKSWILLPVDSPLTYSPTRN